MIQWYRIPTILVGDTTWLINYFGYICIQKKGMCISAIHLSHPKIDVEIDRMSSNLNICFFGWFFFISYAVFSTKVHEEYSDLWRITELSPLHPPWLRLLPRQSSAGPCCHPSASCRLPLLLWQHSCSSENGCGVEPREGNSSAPRQNSGRGEQAEELRDRRQLWQVPALGSRHISTFTISLQQEQDSASNIE